MMKQAQNNVIIEGILSEINLRINDSYEKNGIRQKSIAGFIKVKVVQEIEGQEVELDVPVNAFAAELKLDGGKNPSFVSLEQVLNEYKSIAAVGEEQADRIRITGARITMNEYYSVDGKFISYPRVQGSFVRRIKPEDCNMRALWEMEMYLTHMDYRTDREGIETDTFEVKGVTVGYGGYADVVPLVTTQGNIAAGIKATYQEGDTVPFSGKLNFSTSTEIIYEEVEIGDPIEKARTITISDLVITGAKGALEEGYTPAEIKSVMQKREERLTASLTKSQATGAKGRTAPAAEGPVDLGF